MKDVSKNGADSREDLLDEEVDPLELLEEMEQESEQVAEVYSVRSAAQHLLDGVLELVQGSYLPLFDMAHVDDFFEFFYPEIFSEYENLISGCN
jgi:hypothetical protein